MDLTQQRLLFKNLTPKQKEIIEYYHENNMAMLRKICDPIIFRKGVASGDYDELYGVASDTILESLASYDDTKECQFHTYLTGNIKRAFYDWTRDRRRFKRCNLTEERDENGNLVKDKNGKQKYVVVADISIDAPVGDDSGATLKDMLASGYDIEEELAEEIGISSSGSKMDKYLERLSKKQRQVAIYLSEGYKPSEIRDLLHIDEKEYNDCLMAIRSYKNIKILL